MTVRVDGQEIAEAAIAAEMQFHPAASRQAARQAAVEALVVRTLLLAEARRRGFDAEPAGGDPGAQPDELPEEAAIRRLIEAEVAAAEPDEAAMQAHYAANRAAYRSPDLWEAQHILIAADPRDAAATAGAEAKVRALLAEVLADPDRIGALARAHSDCPSRSSDGHLGQVARGSAVPEFETFLAALEPGQVCPVPVHSRYGWHVVRLLKSAPGRELPYAQARPRILDRMRDRAWREAAQRYVAGLVARARIEGVTVTGGGPAPH